jgi:hypothetical protein
VSPPASSPTGLLVRPSNTPGDARLFFGFEPGSTSPALLWQPRADTEPLRFTIPPPEVTQAEAPESLPDPNPQSPDPLDPQTPETTPESSIQAPPVWTRLRLVAETNTVYLSATTAAPGEPADWKPLGAADLPIAEQALAGLFTTPDVPDIAELILAPLLPDSLAPEPSPDLTTGHSSYRTETTAPAAAATTTGTWDTIAADPEAPLPLETRRSDGPGTITATLSGLLPGTHHLYARWTPGQNNAVPVTIQSPEATQVSSPVGPQSPEAIQGVAPVSPPASSPQASSPLLLEIDQSAGAYLWVHLATVEVPASGQISVTLHAPESAPPINLNAIRALGITFPDDDQDGMPDSWELANGLDPTIADADSDHDADGRSAILELFEGTNPALDEYLAAAPPSLDGKIFVNPVTGSDTLSGKARLRIPGYAHGPKRTIAGALNQAGNGDTIILEPTDKAHLAAGLDLSGKNVMLVINGTLDLTGPPSTEPILSTDPQENEYEPAREILPLVPEP